MLRGGGKGDGARDKNEFPTLDEAAGALVGSTAGEMGPGMGSRLGSMGVGLHSNEKEEEEEEEEQRDPGLGREEGRGAVAAWGMKKGAGEGMWQGSDYVMLRHARVGTSVELVSQDEHFSFLFSCRAGGEVRAFLGASGVAFTSGFCAELQTAKDRTRRVEGQHGVWKFQVHGDDDELIRVTHKNGVGCGELILTSRGFVFVPEGATQAIVVEDAKVRRSRLPRPAPSFVLPSPPSWFLPHFRPFLSSLLSQPHIFHHTLHIVLFGPRTNPRPEAVIPKPNKTTPLSPPLEQSAKASMPNSIH